MRSELSESAIRELFQGYVVDLQGSPDLIEHINNLMRDLEISSEKLLDEFEVLAMELNTDILDNNAINLLRNRFVKEQDQKIDRIEVDQDDEPKFQSMMTPAKPQSMPKLERTPLNRGNMLPPLTPPHMSSAVPASSASSAKKDKFAETFNVKFEPVETPVRKSNPNQLSMTTPQRISSFNPRNFLFTPSPAVKASPASEPFLGRLHKGQVKMVLNDGLTPCQRANRSPTDQLLQAEYLPYNPEYTINLSEEEEMWNQQSARARGLIDQMLESVKMIAKEDEDISLHTIVEPHQTEVYMAGIICTPDAIQTSFENRSFDRKLDNLSVFLEIWDGQGDCVQLNLDSVGNFSLFPGQVVLVKGTNPDGRMFHVSSLLTGALPSKDSERTESLSSDRDCVVYSVSGPYSLSSALDYTPLDEFLGEVKKDNPDVVVLCGPFLDENHNAVKTGNLETDYDSFFHSLLHKIAEKVPSSTLVIFVPSTRDIQHHSIFPQIPYQLRNVPANWEFVSNPSLIQIDPLGLQLGVCSADILMDLSRAEFSKQMGNVPRDRMSELAIHLLQQQCFYPLFPVPQKSGLNLDDSGKALSLDFVPDIMILPSALTAFAKILLRTDCICINPGLLMKGDSAGTYSRIHIHKGMGSFSPRTRVEIVRL